MAISLTSGTMDAAADNIGPPVWDLVRSKIVALNQINVEKKYEALGSMGFFLAFLRGVVANWLVCLGVTMALVSKSVPGKLLACWLPITAFQTMGMEHIVGESVLTHSRSNSWLWSSFYKSDFLELSSCHPRQYRWWHGVHWHALLQHASHHHGERAPHRA